MDSPRRLTLCRVTVNVADAKVGEQVLVDLGDVSIASMVAKGVLVPLEQTTARDTAAADGEKASVAPQEPSGGDAAGGTDSDAAETAEALSEV